MVVQTQLHWFLVQSAPWLALYSTAIAVGSLWGWELINNCLQVVFKLMIWPGYLNF